MSCGGIGTPSGGVAGAAGGRITWGEGRRRARRVIARSRQQRASRFARSLDA